MAEYLDIVDALDRVIGKALRSEIHAQGLMHRAVHIVLFNSVGEVFVQLRSESKDTNPGVWDSSAAGHVDHGESYIDCALRELQEELGIILSASALCETQRFAPSARNGFEFVRVYAAKSDDPLTLEAGEIDDGKWLFPSVLDKWIAETPQAFAPSFIDIWQNTSIG